MNVLKGNKSQQASYPKTIQFCMQMNANESELTSNQFNC